MNKGICLKGQLFFLFFSTDTNSRAYSKTHHVFRILYQEGQNQSWSRKKDMCHILKKNRLTFQISGLTFLKSGLAFLKSGLTFQNDW